VDDAMTDAANLGTAVPLSQPVGDEAERGAAVLDRAVQLPLAYGPARTILGRKPRIAANPLNLSARLESPGFSCRPPEHGKLQAG
jgi:hypothetical protein